MLSFQWTVLLCMQSTFSNSCIGMLFIFVYEKVCNHSSCIWRQGCSWWWLHLGPRAKQHSGEHSHPLFTAIVTLILQLILWGASNSQRQVLVLHVLFISPKLTFLVQDLFSRYPVADERRQALLPIPYGERPTNYRWNSDPLDLDGSYGGSEMDAGYFVLPYWMVSSVSPSSFLLIVIYSRVIQARFHGFIEK